VVHTHPLVGDHRARDAAAQVLERLALLGGAVEVCFDTKKRQGVALPEDVKAKLQAAAQR